MKILDFLKREVDENREFYSKQRTAAEREKQAIQALLDASPDAKKRPYAQASLWLNEADRCASTVNTTTSPEIFFGSYARLIQLFGGLSQLERKVKFKATRPSAELAKLKAIREEQTSAFISRSFQKVMDDVSRSRDSREGDAAISRFLYELNFHGSTMTEKNRNEVGAHERRAKAVAASLPQPRQLTPHASGTAILSSEFARYGGVSAELLTVDLMQGNDFEHWCANLLMRLGFSGVEVTKASGDHGVDVLATKDGIRYAVQCKCYSSDLGNKPIQEVHAGKDIYRCQIGAVMTNQYFTAGARKLAEATGVLLWDRDWLVDSLDKAEPA